MTINIIAAQSLDRAIGRDSKLLWHLPEDLAMFRRITTGHPVVMGRKTYEAIGSPLKNRKNIVISNTSYRGTIDTIYAPGIEEAIRQAQVFHDEVFVIGGGQIYQECLPLTDRMYLTTFKGYFPDADTYFPEIDPQDWQLIYWFEKPEYKFEILEKKSYQAIRY